ncbi:McrB family protein [Streptococcus porcinus]|uniref:Restriction enzyme n=1 Tax=Streptococcus porcinus TaxID=1340 RepID=A0A4V0GZM2_STRPO|nr:AAA family ATPase [Streptococcus porcinus]VTT42140.1 restriction enzyme [Streptococcus porcinus]VTT43593.1 restriction enzyme [Streptococcus porcinus]
MKKSLVDSVNTLHDLLGSTSKNSNLNKSFHQSSLKSQFNYNRIIFGAPGTGKSYKLKIEMEQLLGGNEHNFERVTFHPAYSYAQFVGTYKPTPIKNSEGKEEITYKFVPGPFLRIYVKAMQSIISGNPQPFLLLIEEINRAEVAAVFGDVFQLLDRKSGISEYPIQVSEDMKNYLMEQLNIDEIDASDLKIPDNLYIWATMNSADQGVFPIDTAFKRRWDFEYLSLDQGDEKISGFVFVKNGKSFEWNTLRKAINSVLISEYGINEDKLMGPFFLKLDDFKVLYSDQEKNVETIELPESEYELLEKKIIDNEHEYSCILDSEKFIKAFYNKVIMYLFEDAAKQRRKQLFEGVTAFNQYSQICEEFEKRDLEIFTKTVSDKYTELFPKG